MKKIYLSLALSFTLTTISYAEENAASLMAKAMQMIQKGEKKKALPVLEKAFEASKDTDEIKDIGILILEASPKEYAKRESFLRYLIKNYPEHGDRGKWLKEMADRKFDAAQFDDAEELYLQAASAPDVDQNTIKYKLAWVAWNQKNRELALNRFLDLYDAAETSLKEQLRKDMSKIWLEAGELPANLFDRLSNLPSDDLREMSTRVIQSLSPQMIPQEKEESLLTQFKNTSTTSDVLKETLNRGGLLFVKEPCFLFHKVIQPEDAYSSHLLLACAASKRRPKSEELLPYFLNYKGPREETIDWAHAECLVDVSRKEDAANLLLSPDQDDLKKRSKDHIKFLVGILLSLEEGPFRAVYSLAGAQKLETVMSVHSDDQLLLRLEAIDPEGWLAFEESQIKEGRKKQTRAFLERKGVHLIQTKSASEEDLSKILDDIYKAPDAKVSKADKAMKDQLGKLRSRKSTRLPGTFTPAFKTEYDRWVKDLDQSLKALEASSNNLQMIARPVYQAELRKNIDEMKSQIEGLTLDAELQSLAPVFEKKKGDLSSDLEKKYRGFLEPAEGSR